MSKEKVTSNIHIENAELIFKNFRGKGSDYNDEGNRNFGILISDQMADDLKRDGWKVKYLRARVDDPDHYEQPWLPVKVKFNPYPPIAVLINSRGKKKLTEETIEQLDWTRIESCDIIIRPYNYPAIKGRPAGVSAYLKAIYVIIQEDEFEKKYADVPDLDDGDDGYDD